MNNDEHAANIFNMGTQVNYMDDACKQAFELFINQHWYSVNALKPSTFSNRTYDSNDIENMWRGFRAAWGKRGPLIAALEQAEEALDCLRRGHGVEVGSKCYPALNSVRDALQRSKGS